MPHDNQFGLFIHDDQGPLYRGFYNDLDVCKREAQHLADQDGFPYFIVNFKTMVRIATFKPEHGAAAAKDFSN